uniref:Uncharacterized protein n=1 Tax=Anguilla anguilla TaxID=7936 RepID=A0A0E9VXM8_ANGAN
MIHPKGVRWGRGQGCVWGSQDLPHQTQHTIH